MRVLTSRSPCRKFLRILVLPVVVVMITVLVCQIIPASVPLYDNKEAVHPQRIEVIHRNSEQRALPEAASDNDVYASRREQMHRACDNMDPGFYKVKNSEIILRNHFMIDRKHELVYCGIEKVGCSFWKRILLVLLESGKDQRNPFHIPARVAHAKALESFRRLSFPEIFKILSSYTKFLFVREPYSRLFSGYIDKIFTPDEQYFWLRKHIAKLTRPGNRDWECGTEITFAEFVKYVIHSIETGESREGHFVQMFDHCRPCQIDYDIIGKMESFSADTGYILRSRGLGSIINPDISESETDADAITDVIDHFFRWRESIEKCIPFTKATKDTWKKLQIRGFLEKTIPLPVEFEVSANFSKADFKVAVMQAYRDSDRTKSRTNRKNALAEAYRSVSIEDIRKFRQLFRTDFEAFGYDINLSDSFNSQNRTSFFS